MHKTLKTGVIGQIKPSNRTVETFKNPPTGPAATFIGARVNAWGVPLYDVRVSSFAFDIGV